MTLEIFRTCRQLDESNLSYIIKDMSAPQTVRCEEYRRRKNISNYTTSIATKFTLTALVLTNTLVDYNFARDILLSVKQAKQGKNNCKSTILLQV